MKSAPELMTAALNLHNGVMRKVRWENYMSGKTNRREIVERPGTNNVCFVAPEMMEAIITILAKLQREFH